MHTKSRDNWVAAAFVAPFVIAYLVLFLYPTVRMVILTFTDAPLIGAGKWIGFKNYQRLFNDKAYIGAVWNTAYFVLLTVIPTAPLGLVFAMRGNRQRG